MKEKALIAKSAVWSLFSSLFNKLIAFLYTIIIARILLEQEVGAFYLVLSILGVLYIFTDLGIVYYLNRSVPFLYGRGEIKKLVSLVKLCYFGAGGLTLLFSIATFLFSGTISNLIGQPSVISVLQLTSVWLFIKELDDINRGVLNGRKKIVENQSLDILQNITKLGVTLVAFYMLGAGSSSLSIGFLVSFIILLPVGFYWVYSEVRSWKVESGDTGISPVDLAKEAISFGLVTTLISSLWAAMQYTDRIMIGFLLPDSLGHIAIYSLALGFANLALIFPSAVGSMFFTVISELYGKKDYEEIARTTAISTKWIVMSMTPIVLVMIIFSGSLLSLFYGQNYGAGALVLVFFVFALFIRSLFMLPSSILVAMFRLDVELITALVALIVNVILNFVFIPSMGINGAALASAIAIICSNMVVWHYSRKIFNFKFPSEALKPLLATIISFVILFLLRDSILVSIDKFASEIHIGLSKGQFADEILQKVVKLSVFGALFALTALIYFLFLFVLKAFGKEELSLLESGLKKLGLKSNQTMAIRKLLEGE